jgi:hypothetical protein
VYTALDVGDTAVEFCECLGTPATALRVVKGDLPVSECAWQGATVRVAAPTAGLRIADGEAVAGGASFARQVLLDNSQAYGVGGFEFAVVCKDALVALTGIDYEGCAALERLNGNAGPEFFDVALQAGGWSCGQEQVHGGAVACVVDNEWGGESIPAGGANAIARLLFAANDQGAEGTVEITIPIEGCIPANRAPLVRFTDAVAVTPSVHGTSATVLAGAVRFVRSDANGDGGIDIADAIAVLSYLFSKEPLDCLASGDGNNDGAVDIADAISTLGYLFARGPTPAAPFPGCGLPAVEKLGCERFDACNP